VRWLIVLPSERPGLMGMDFADELRALGHEVSEIGACGVGAVVTRRDPETGALSAGADPRRPTYALAW